MTEYNRTHCMSMLMNTIFMNIKKWQHNDNVTEFPLITIIVDHNTVVVNNYLDQAYNTNKTTKLAEDQTDSLKGNIVAISMPSKPTNHNIYKHRIEDQNVWVEQLISSFNGISGS